MLVNWATSFMLAKRLKKMSRCFQWHGRLVVSNWKKRRPLYCLLMLIYRESKKISEILFYIQKFLYIWTNHRKSVFFFANMLLAAVLLNSLSRINTIFTYSWSTQLLFPLRNNKNINFYSWKTITVVKVCTKYRWDGWIYWFIIGKRSTHQVWKKTRSASRGKLWASRDWDTSSRKAWTAILKCRCCFLYPDRWHC